MLAKNISIYKLFKVFFVLLIVGLVGLSLALVVQTNADSYALASDTTGTNHIDAEIGDFAESVETGASITLEASDLVVTPAPNDSIATATATETATITLSGDIWEAVKSGRITATLLATGFNKYELLQGESTSKEASYSVSGAMSGGGNFSIVDQEFNGLVIAPRTLLNADNGNTITITYTSLHVAEDHNIGLGTSFAEAKISGYMSFTLSLEFENAIVTIGATNGGIVRDGNGNIFDSSIESSTLEFGFEESAIFTAVPDAGYYFIGWREPGASSNTSGITLDLGKAVEIESGTSHSYQAQFQKIDVSESSTKTYSYMVDQSQGPVVNATRYTGVYYLTHSYTGQANNGVSVDLASEGAEKIVAGPKSAGQYTYECEFFYRVPEEDGSYSKGDKIGGVTIEFTIDKNAATVVRGVDNATTATIRFGDNLSALDMTFTATNSADKRSNVSGSLSLYKDGEPADQNRLLPISATGLEYTVRFTPNDSNNYSIVDTPLTVVVKDEIKDNGTNVNGTTMTYTIAKAIATSIDDATVESNVDSLVDGAEVVKISLRATMEDRSGQYFFIGWRIGLVQSDGTYAYNYLNSGKVNRDASGNVTSIDGLNFDFYMPYYGDESYTTEQKESYKSAIFQAVFVKDTTCGTSADTLNILYSGAMSNLTPKTSPDRAGYGFGFDSMLYYHESALDTGVATAPTSIGNHVLKYNIVNSEKRIVVDTRVINYIIVIGEVSVKINEDNSIYNSETGWAYSLIYNLTVPNLLAGGTTKYYYSTNGNDWIAIEGTITQASGCRITFTVPTTPETTSVMGYTFIATHDTHGQAMLFGELGEESTFKVVAMSTNFTVAKIDTVTPTFDSLSTTYGGEWTNGSIPFDAVVNYGGSGAVIDVNLIDGDSSIKGWRNVPSTNLGLLVGDDDESYQGIATQFGIDAEYTGRVTFRVRNGVGMSSEAGEEITINVDKTAPIIPNPSANRNVNAYGWIGEATTFTYAISDNGGSNISNVVAINLSKGGESHNIIEANGAYEIVIEDSYQYQITATDSAGNFSVANLQANVDSQELAYNFNEDSYLAGEWAFADSSVIVDISMGASGARLECSVDGGDFIPVSDFSNTNRELLTQEFSLSYALPVSETVKSYIIRIVTRSGKTAEFELGEVKFDLEDPVYQLLTDLSAYQGSNWTSQNLVAEFTVFDNQGTVNSGIGTVAVDNGGTLENLGDGKYSLIIDKCTVFTIYIQDVAGNLITREIQANVDTVVPEWSEIKAYIGGGDPDDPEQEANPDKVYEEYDFESWITVNRTAENAEPWVRIEFTINLTASGTMLEYSNNNGATWTACTDVYMPEEGQVTGEKKARIFIDDEQDTSYLFRLVTGSGKKAVYDAGKTLRVRLDFTNPTLRSEVFRVGSDNASFPLKEVWTNQTATYRIMAQDTAAGSGVNYDTLFLYAYAYEASDDDIKQGKIDETEKITLTKTGDYYTYVFGETVKYKYLLKFSDYAGNEYDGDVFIPHVDLTDGFSMTVSGLVYYDGVGSVDLATEANYWIENGGYALFKATPYFAEGTDDFGPSGGGLEFSIDGGNTWQTSQYIAKENVSIAYNGEIYTLQINNDQVNTYQFRLITGAGNAYNLETTYNVQKDNTNPTITASVAYKASGADYDGSWTKDDLRFTLNVTLGAAGATIEVGVGETADSAEWKAVQTIAPNNPSSGSTYYYVVDDSSNGTYFFRVVSGRTDLKATTDSGIIVKLDKEEIVVTANATYTVGGQQINVASGSWIKDETTIYPSITLGESGISKVYYKTDSGLGYGEYAEITADADNSQYNVILNSNTTLLVGYIFKIVSGSGMEAESVEFKVGFDNVTPTVQIAFDGTKLDADNFYKDWYVTNVGVQVSLDADPASGYKVFYQQKNVGETTYSEWKEVDATFTLNDRSIGGGTDAYYQFKVVTGSGIEVALEESASDTEYYLPIDVNSYEVNVELFVGDIADDSYASVNGAGSYQRGEVVSIAIVANATYSIKNRVTVGATPSVADSSTEKDSDEFSFTVGGNDVNVTAHFYKELTLEYTNEKQYLQSGDIVDVGYKAIEEGFDEFFGAVSTVTSGKRVGVKAVYTNVKGEEVSRPSAIGTYKLTLTMQDGFEHYRITNSETTLTVVYFEGDGTVRNPYIVRNLNDFYYIDQYMHFEDGDELEDSRAYLGANRRTANFKQDADIELTSDFKPIARKNEADGYTNEFMGSYDGNGYEFIYTRNLVASGDFGLFLNINGASITNLGVRYNVRANEDVDGANIGLIVANAVDSGLRSVYAIGNVSLKGKDVKVGGIVGNMIGTLISYSYSNVSVTATATSGYIGGIVGYMDKAYTANSYTISRITVTNSKRYDPSAEAGTKFVYAGTIAGYAVNFEDKDVPSKPTDSNKSYFLDKNIGFDGSIEQGLSLGNRDNFALYAQLMHQESNIDFFMSASSEGSHADVKIHDIAERNYSVTVHDLVLMTINSVKDDANMQGDGTTESPFLVDSEAKLKLIETFPWASFKQTADIMLAEGTALAVTIPFVGVYDGDNYSLTGALVESDTIRYGGVFGVVSGTIKNLKIVDVSLRYSSTYGAIYAGGAVGVLEEGGTIQNVTVTGTLKAESSNDTVYAGGIVGVVLDGTISNSIASVNVNADGVNVVVGNLVAQVQGNSRIENVVSTSSLSAHYEKRVNIGTTVGAVVSSDTTIASIYSLAQSTYANDKGVASIVGYDMGATLMDVQSKSRQEIMATELNGTVVGEIITALYPLKGEGTNASPFLIGTYQELLLVSNYMYASFELVDNIVIGDYNDDGKFASDDGYDYDYVPIGKGATFTGSLDGNGYSILGLSDSLFEVNAGAVSDITLNMNYKVYASEDDIPNSEKTIDSVTGETYTSAKVAERDGEILFGALAKVNKASGSLIRVNVSGNIYIRTSGRAKVILGGIVGVDMGGQIVASQLSANLSVNANQMVIGGIVGEIKSSDRALSQITMNDVIISSGINLGGGAYVAGIYIGKINVETGYVLNFVSSTQIIYNGNSLGNTQYVGYQLNK